MQYAFDLESEIAQLEQELGDQVDTLVPPSRQSCPLFSPTKLIKTLDEHDTVTCEEITASDKTTVTESDMAHLIESISKVSLSATTEKAAVPFQSQDILTTLILSAAVPAGFSHITACSSSLPPRDIVDAVLQTYLQKAPPTKRFITRDALLSHCHSAYAEVHDSSYSAFLIGVIVATTVVSSFPDSLPSALQLYHYSVQRLAIALVDKSDDSLRELEAVIALSCFAQSIPFERVEPPSPKPEVSTHRVLPNLASLAALGIRIAVDHGLHSSIKTSREGELFHAAYTIELEVTKRHDLPNSLPEAAIRF
jgi:hypothetical protein